MAEVRFTPEKSKVVIETPEQFTIILNREEAKFLYRLLADIENWRHELTEVQEILLTIL